MVLKVDWKEWMVFDGSSGGVRYRGANRLGQTDEKEFLSFLWFLAP